MTGGGEKVTAIFVGGAMDAHHYGNLRSAVTAYPSDATFAMFLPEHPTSDWMRKYPFTFSPSRENFRRFAPFAVRGHGGGGILHFVQFGHGEKGPSLILGDGFVRGKELVDLFQENVDRVDKPFTAVILGGCFSGGFGSLFFDADGPGQPDFFFGASPPFTVAFSGLDAFFAEICDPNGDGIVTHREHGVCEMNHGANPLAVMYQRRGSPDIDFHGRRALKPYFPKEVQKAFSHKDMMELVKGLNFGEQMVVLVSGGDGIPPDLEGWFEREARDGDGFYKFVAVADNAESRQFFNTSAGPAVYVMGPNLRYHGVRLETSKPVGDQIPRILATENPLLVLAGWGEKSEMTSSNYLFSLYRKYLGENRDFSPKDILEKSKTLLWSEKAEEHIDGLRLLRAVLEADGIDDPELVPLLHRLIPVPGQPRQPSQEELLLLAGCISLLEGEKAREDLQAVVIAGFNYYGEAFLGELGKSVRLGSRVAGEAMEEEIKSTNDPLKNAELLMGLSVASSDSYYGIEYAMLHGLDDKEHLPLRRAAAFFLSRMQSHGRAAHTLTLLGGAMEGQPQSDELSTLINKGIEKLVVCFRQEKDDIVRGYLLTYLAHEMREQKCGPLERFIPEVKALADSKETPSVVQKAAREFLSAIDARQKDELQRQKDELQRQKDEEKAEQKFRGDVLSAAVRSQWSGGPQFFARHDGDTWTGGLGGGTHGDIFQRGLWVDSKARHVLSASLMAGVNFDVHWMDDWITIYPTIGPALNLFTRDTTNTRYYDNNSLDLSASNRVSLSAGYALRYMPVRDYKGVAHGVTAALEFSEFDHPSDGAGRGPSFRLTYFPPEDGRFTDVANGDLIFSVGVKP